MVQEGTLLRIVKYAAKAPSGHNAQPWRFRTGNGTISLLPDFTRALPVVDSDNHALFISLGCALENIVIAANQFNYESVIEFDGDEREPYIRVRLFAAQEARKSGLFDYIVKRQVTRNRYNNEKIPQNILGELFDDAPDEGVQTKLFLSEAGIMSLVPYITEGIRLQFRKKGFVDELATWIRFSGNEVMLRGDGIWTASMGLPNMGRLIGSFVMKNLITAGIEARRIEKLVTASAGMALFIVRQNDPYHWIKLGQSFQRFALKATKNQVSHSHVNMPCEEPVVREKLIRDFQLKEMTPLLLIRFGYSRPMPYSFRRNLNDLLDQ